MASYEKRGKRSWHLIVEAGYDAQEKRIKEIRTIKIEDDKLLKTTKKLNDYLNTELMKFRLEIQSEKSLDNYLFHLNKRIIPYFERMKVSDIKTMHIIEFLTTLKPLNGKRAL